MGNVIDIDAARDRMNVRRQDRNPIARALDALALALADHGHTWTAEERDLYETGIMYALDMTGDGWRKIDGATPLGKEIILFYPAYTHYSELLGREHTTPAAQQVSVMMMRQSFTRPEPTHWRFLAENPKDATVVHVSSTEPRTEGEDGR